MRTWISAIVLVAVAVMFQPTAQAQSIWQKMKQAAKQSEQTSQAQQRQRQQAAQRGSTNATNSQRAAADPPPPPVDLSSPVFKALFHKLDVGGLQMGMTPQEARAIIHHRYPTLTESQERPYVFNDLPKTEFTSELVFTPGNGTNNGNTRVGLTLQPMQPVVLSITRTTEYERDHAPTVDNTVAALRAKYGPESERIDSRQMDGLSLLWVFDGAGNQVSSRDVERFLGLCPRMYRDPSAGYISDPQTINWSANCRSSTFMQVNVSTYVGNLTNSQGQSLPQGLVMRIGVDVISFPLFMKTIAEARTMVLAAKDANLKKTKKAADQVTPTL